MKISDTLKKFVDTTAEIETKLGNPMACFLEEQEREEKEREEKEKEEKAHHENTTNEKKRD